MRLAPLLFASNPISTQVQALAAIGPDTIASASRDCLIKVWSVNTGTCQYDLGGHSNWVTCLHWSSQAGMLLSGSDDGTLRCWSLTDRRCVFSDYGHRGDVTAVTSVQFKDDDGALRREPSSEGGGAPASSSKVIYVVTASADKTLCCWELRQEKVAADAGALPCLLCAR